jgi:hypothetical protein
VAEFRGSRVHEPVAFAIWWKGPRRVTAAPTRRSKRGATSFAMQKLVVESAIMPKSRAEMLNDLRQLMAEYSVFQRSRPDLPQGNLLELSQDELEQLVMEFQQYKSEQRDEMIRPARVH